MSIRPIDFNGMLQRADDVSHVKHVEDAKPVVDQQNIQVQVDQRADQLRHEVSDPNTSGETQNNSDAREEGRGIYFDNRKKKKDSDKSDADARIIKKVSTGGFDIKI